MRKCVAQMRGLVKVVFKSVQRGARDKWSGADSVVQQRSEEEDEAGGVAAGRRVVVSQCAGDCAGGEVVVGRRRGRRSRYINRKVILRAEGDDLRAGDFSLCA